MAFGSTALRVKVRLRSRRNDTVRPVSKRTDAIQKLIRGDPRPVRIKGQRFDRTTTEARNGIGGMCLALSCILVTMSAISCQSERPYADVDLDELVSDRPDRPWRPVPDGQSKDSTDASDDRAASQSSETADLPPEPPPPPPFRGEKTSHWGIARRPALPGSVPGSPPRSSESLKARGTRSSEWKPSSTTPE